MKILVYHGLGQDFEKKLQDSITFPESCEIAFIRDCNCDKFSALAWKCFSGDTVIVFIALGSEDMDCLEAAMKSLSDIKLIIKVPWGDHDLFSRAIALCPCYIDQDDDSHHNIILVLEKIFQNEARKTRLGKAIPSKF